MPSSSRPIRRALLSVSDKAGLVSFAQALAARGVALVSTGLTMIASTLLAMKFCIWLSCLETSSLASSICSVTPGSVLA